MTNLGSLVLRGHGFMLGNLVAKNFKTLYRNMALGVLWSILNPLILVVVVSLVWTFFFEAPRSFPSFLLVALIPFNFSSQCISGCTNAIVGNAELVKGIAFRLEALPVSVVITHTLHLVIQVPLLAAVFWLFRPPGGASVEALLFLAPVFLIHAGFLLGLGLLVSSINVVYRDVQYLVESALVVSFWLCPIVYDPYFALKERPAALFVAYYLNPLAGVLQSYRNVLYFGTAPPWDALGLSTLVAVIVAWVGIAVFRRQQREFVDFL